MKIKGFARFRRAFAAALFGLVLGGIGLHAGAQAPVTPGDEERYTVTAGDTVIGISRRLLHEGETRRMQRALARHNALDDADQISPGQVLRVPRAWLKSRPGTLEVAEHQGAVTSGGQPVRSGQQLAGGADIVTGHDGYATLKLVDGSSLMLLPSSTARIERAQTNAAVRNTDTVIRLERGRTETSVEKPVAGSSRFEIRTPVAVAAVRGTKFRVASNPSGSGSTSEVIEGEVGVSDAQARGGVGVAAGYGTRVDAGAAPLAPRPLLPGPFLWSGTRLVERRQSELTFNPLRAAIGYRVFVSPRADFRVVLTEAVIPRAVFPLQGLADGTYFFRVRGIDDIGLEGRDTVAQMLVRVRPDAPRTLAPTPGRKVYGTAVELSWAADPAATSYLVQVAGNAAFRDGLREFPDLNATSTTVRDLAPGRYVWRVSSAQAQGRRSLYSDPVAFEMRPLPRPPSPPRIEADTLAFVWTGEPGQTFEIELSADAGFGTIAHRLRTTALAGSLPRPAGGTYFARLRATDADGSESPYSAAVEFRVPIRIAAPPCLVMDPDGVCATYGPRRSPPSADK